MKTNRINLLWIGTNLSAPNWEFGDIFISNSTLQSIYEILQSKITVNLADAWLFWDSELGDPPLEIVQKLLDTNIDVWHAGLKLGLGGHPSFIDYVSPTWMLNRDPDLSIEATSWRLSLRCCLIRTEVLWQMGGPQSGFSTLEAASLEMGYRYIRNGVFMRHSPELLPNYSEYQEVAIPVKDQLLFIKYCFSKKWLYWAMFRALMNSEAGVVDLVKSWKTIKNVVPERQIKPYQHNSIQKSSRYKKEQVSVLIPTVNRYPYLKKLLAQLRNQTLKPFEIIVVDQTDEDNRDSSIQNEFSDLPLRWFILNKAGQCRSRNFGLNNIEGDYVLFLDDDEEICNSFIEMHVISIDKYNTSVSSGIVQEIDNKEIPYHFSYVRESDVFPAGNSFIKKTILEKSGLFDLAYDQGQRADGDLGMRIYLSGELMVLNPEISILHHHAPQGGLRQHKARVHTYAASRKSIALRVLPSVSDIYLSRRYFTSKQVREMLWISILGTFSLHGPRWKKVIKGIISFLMLPSSIREIKKRFRKVDQMLEIYPQIPEFQNKS